MSRRTEVLLGEAVIDKNLVECPVLNYLNCKLVIVFLVLHKAQVHLTVPYDFLDPNVFDFLFSLEHDSGLKHTIMLF